MTESATLQPAISTELKSRFDINGFINFGRVLDDDELAAIRERIDAIGDGTVQAPEKCVRFQQGLAWGPGTSLRRRDAVWQLLGLGKHDDVFRSICQKPLIHQILETLLGEPAQYWSDQVIMKPANHGGVVPWHQDTSYWGQERRMTCWIAIDDATPANGCMRMIPGSHLRGQLKFTPKPFDGAPQELLVTDGVNEDTQVYVPVRAGCASIHHPLTLHASNANTTPFNRRGLAVTYQAEG